MSSIKSLATAGSMPKGPKKPAADKPVKEKPSQPKKSRPKSSVPSKPARREAPKGKAPVPKPKDSSSSRTKSEHIATDKNRDIDFEYKGEKFGGWIEPRDVGRADIVVIHGSEYKTAKDLDAKDVKGLFAKTKALADALLSGDDETNERVSESALGLLMKKYGINEASVDDDCDCDDDDKKEEEVDESYTDLVNRLIGRRRTTKPRVNEPHEDVLLPKDQKLTDEDEDTEEENADGEPTENGSGGGSGGGAVAGGTSPAANLRRIMDSINAAYTTDVEEDGDQQTPPQFDSATANGVADAAQKQLGYRPTVSPSGSSGNFTVSGRPGDELAIVGMASQVNDRQQNAVQQPQQPQQQQQQQPQQPAVTPQQKQEQQRNPAPLGGSYSN